MKIKLTNVQKIYVETSIIATAIINGKKVRCTKYTKQDETFGNFESDISMNDDDKAKLSEEEQEELYNYLNDEAEW